MSETDPLMTYPEVGRRLRVSRFKIWAMVKAGDLPAVRIGGRVLFKTSDVERLIESSTTPNPAK